MFRYTIGDRLTLTTPAHNYPPGKYPVMTKFPVIDADPGVTRQVLADHPDLMVVAFTFAHEGAEGKLHHHPHIQSTFVKSGSFKFTVDGVETNVGPGDSFVIPTNVVHGCVCLEPGTLIDSFTPRRDDFL